MWPIIVKIGKGIFKTLAFLLRNVMAIVALIIAGLACINQTVANNTQEIIEVNQGISAKVESLDATTLKLLAQQDSIKKILLSQQGGIGSLKFQIDSLDDCIDRYFHSVNKTLNTRFSYIGGRLHDIKEGAPR